MAFAHVTVVIDVFNGCIVCWRVSRSMQTNLVLDALELALHARQVGKALIHRSDRGARYRSIQRAAQGRRRVSICGQLGRLLHQCNGETTIDLFKTEMIHARGPWRSLDAAECAALEWVGRFNNRRLLDPIGHVPKAEFEAEYYPQQSSPAIEA